jgi:hypothetical protein
MTGKTKPKTPEVCPVCGEDVPPESLACPECGADHNSGWNEETLDVSSIPSDEDFDYAEYVKEEFGSEVKPRGLKTIWWITGIVLLILSVFLALMAIF